MKAMSLTLAAFILALGLVLPASAQDNIVNLHFRLTVQGAPCPNATYWGFFGLANTDDVNYVRLMDPEGDGIYTGTGTHFAAPHMVAQIIQGTGTGLAYTIGGGSTFEVPGEPSRVIQDFGSEDPDRPYLVPHLSVTEDMVFEASVEGCPAGLPDTGGSDSLPVVWIVGAALLLAGGAYLRRRTWQQA